MRSRKGEAGPEANRLQEPERAFTIRDLMTHTSGMGDYPEALQVYTKMDLSLEDTVKAVAKEPLLVPARGALELLQPGHRHPRAHHRGRLGPDVRGLPDASASSSPWA